MNLTPSETETLKMFREKFPYQITRTNENLEDFLLTQLRLARADERKQAYEEILAMDVPAFWEKTSLHGQAFIDCKFLIARRIESARKA